MARGRVMTNLPSIAVEGQGADERRTRYGEPVVQALNGSNDSAHAVGGSYFVAQTATPGTAYNLTGATQTAWVATTPTLTVFNNAAAGGAFLIPDFLQITFATAGVAGTRVEGAIVTDTITRRSSGGTLLTSYNARSDSAYGASPAVAYGGDITAVAASAPKYVGRFTLSTAIPAIGETYRIEFGAPVASSVGSKTARVSPIVVPPQASVLVYLWLPSQTTAPTGEVSFGYWMR